jgi:hypothetical protein
VPVPSVIAAGTYVTGTATNVAVPVPSGTAANVVVLVNLMINGASVTVTPPSGFVEAICSPSSAGGLAPQSCRVFWKRCTGTDAGTYNFSWGASRYHEACGTTYANCAVTGSPFDAACQAAQNSSLALTTPSVSITVGGVNRLLCWAGSCSSLAIWTSPAGFTLGLPGLITVSTQAFANLALPLGGVSGGVFAGITVLGSTAVWLGALIGLGDSSGGGGGGGGGGPIPPTPFVASGSGKRSAMMKARRNREHREEDFGDYPINYPVRPM